jgi:hypothetical protein
LIPRREGAPVRTFSEPAGERTGQFIIALGDLQIANDVIRHGGDSADFMHRRSAHGFIDFAPASASAMDEAK